MYHSQRRIAKLWYILILSLDHVPVPFNWRWGHHRVQHNLKRGKAYGGFVLIPGIWRAAAPGKRYPRAKNLLLVAQHPIIVRWLCLLLLQQLMCCCVLWWRLTSRINGPVLQREWRIHHEGGNLFGPILDGRGDDNRQAVEMPRLDYSL